MTCDCGKPTSGAWLCDRCCTTLAYALANIAAYYDDLATVAGRQARYGAPGVPTLGRSTREQPLPVDMRFLSGPDVRPTASPGAQLRWDARATVVAWCRTVMDEQPQGQGPLCPGPCLHTSCAEYRRRRWPDDTVRSMCLYLDRMHRWVEGRDYAPAMLDEMTDLERRLRRMVDRPPDLWYAGRCGWEDEHGTCTAELYALPGSHAITCKACGTEWPTVARRELLLDLARDHLVTATQAAHALVSWTDHDGTAERLADRIGKWRDRGKLEVRDVTSLRGRDRHLYRLGDLQDLLVADAQREQRRRTVSV